MVLSIKREDRDNCSGLPGLFPFYIQKMGGAGKAGVVGADQFFDFQDDFRFGEMGDRGEIGPDILLQRPQILGCRGDDIGFLDFSFFIQMIFMPKNSPGDFNSADALAGF